MNLNSQTSVVNNLSRSFRNYSENKRIENHGKNKYLTKIIQTATDIPDVYPTKLYNRIGIPRILRIDVVLFNRKNKMTFSVS